MIFKRLASFLIEANFLFYRPNDYCIIMEEQAELEKIIFRHEVMKKYLYK